jgi:hypothetical protein
MMTKDIQYSGLAAQPSGYQCPDGQLEQSVNLLSEDGSLRPVAAPRALFNLGAGNSVVYIHAGTSYRHYIVLTRPSADSATVSYAWLDATADYTQSDTAAARALTPLKGVGEEATGVTSIANTLMIVTADGVHYYLWKPTEQAYTHLGTSMPELPVSFGLQSKERHTDWFDVTYDKILTAALGAGVEFSDDNKTAITAQVLAKVNKFIAEEATGSGKFIFPFLVRYAYRLYDGTLTRHSAPVLMLATTGPAPVVMIQGATLKNEGCSAKVSALVHSLDYAVLSEEALTTLKQWSDIITAVDIYISKPVYTFDQSGQCQSFIKTSDIDAVSVCLLSGMKARYREYTFQEAWERETNGYVGSTMPSMAIALPEKEAEDVADDIRSCGLFYLLKSIDVANLTTERTLIDIADNYLPALVTRTLMTDDYDSHDELLPGYCFPYNQRMNLANVSKRVFEGYHGGTLFCHSDGFTELVDKGYWQEMPDEEGQGQGQEWVSDLQVSTGYDGTSPVTVYIYQRRDGRELVTVCEAGAVATYRHRLLYLYYPSTSAYKALIHVEGVHDYEVPLTPHDTLNGSLYFAGWQTPDTLPVTRVPVLPDAAGSLERVIEQPSKLYTSEVGNPFLYLASRINTVGTGRIICVSTAARALSQGQYGQFPLYAFTTEGVWALEVNSAGGYSGKQPITADVCLSADSVTQVDNVVFFATARGVMLLSGSDSKCATEVLDAADMASVTAVASDGIEARVAALAGITAGELASVRFIDYAASCRMVYDYTGQRLVVYNPSYPYSYVYSFRSKQWGMMQGTIASGINSYPDALVMSSGGTLVNLSQTDATATPFFLLTRPIKLDAPDTLKSIWTTIQRGRFITGNVKVLMQGSRDLINWVTVRSSATHHLSAIGGTPYKYFRFMLAGVLRPDDYIHGLTVQYEPRYTARPR